MKLKYLAVAASVAVACSGAWAEDIDVTAVDLTTGTAFFGVSHFSAGSFVDTFTFMEPSPSIYSSGAGSLISIALPGGAQDITFTKATLSAGALSIDLPVLLSGPVDIAAATFAAATGPLMLTVEGITAGVGGGTGASYSGTMNVVAVPEPETYALMLAGLGAIGFMARRRRNG